MQSKQTAEELMQSMTPYNPINKLISKNDIATILKKINIKYNLKNLSIFQMSFTHESYIVRDTPFKNDSPKCVELQPVSNERLEYLGDSVIGFIVASYVFHRYEKSNEGFLTKLKTKLVRTKTFAKFSEYLGLNQYILISKYVEEICNGRHNEKILEDLFEAFIGALYEDVYDDNEENYGVAVQMCADVVIQIIENTIDFRPLIAINDNYKELLLHLYHKNWVGIHPTYHEVPTTDSMGYCMVIKHPITGVTVGMAISKKKVNAEQMASKKALKYFEVNGVQGANKIK